MPWMECHPGLLAVTVFGRELMVPLHDTRGCGTERYRHDERLEHHPLGGCEDMLTPEISVIPARAGIQVVR